jgi:hypothetical protein
MRNMFGEELSEPESRVVDCYRMLHMTVEMHGEDLPPFARRNATKALASLWQVMNGLDMDPDQLYGLGA